jgi:hypothetical protein
MWTAEVVDVEFGDATITLTEDGVVSPNSTSTTSAVHIGFGHEPGGAEGVSDSTVKRNWPFRGVARGPLVPATVVLKL